MDMYVRMYDDMKTTEGDNHTLGIVLCTETSEDIARYSVLHDSDQLFASKIMTFLPTPEELRREIEQQSIFWQHLRITIFISNFVTKTWDVMFTYIVSYDLGNQIILYRSIWRNSLSTYARTKSSPARRNCSQHCSRTTL